MLFGKYWRAGPWKFSFAPCCHGLDRSEDRDSGRVGELAVSRHLHALDAPISVKLRVVAER